MFSYLPTVKRPIGWRLNVLDVRHACFAVPQVPTRASLCRKVQTTFSFDTRGAKEKVRKKKTPQVLFRDLRVATGAMRPLTCTACGGATLACAVLINVHLSPDSETSHRAAFIRLSRSPRVLESASGARRWRKALFL
jgi:hypothetical protein